MACKNILLLNPVTRLKNQAENGKPGLPENGR